MSCHEELMAKLPVRRSEEEKHAFRAWAIEKAGAAGWTARTEVNGKAKKKNVVIGDPEHAAVLFTAHYDTAANMLLPNRMMPRNLPVWICWQLLVIVLAVGVSLLAPILVGLITPNARIQACAFLAVYVGILAYMTYGPSNKQNANASSGLAAVLDLMENLPQEDHAKCAFILFDGEERGHAGRKAYAKDHLELAYMRMIVDLNHVGVGDDLLVVSTSMARRCTGYNQMERMLAEKPGKTVHFFDSRFSACGADRKSFKCQVNVLACEQTPGIGFVVKHLRTNRDTVCHAENLAWVVQAFSGFLA